MRAALRASGTGLVRSLAIVESSADGTRLRDFDVDMQRRMHLIVISDDFTTFMHVHPVLGPDGTFRIDVRFPRPGLYDVYADAAPHGLGHPVFRFPLTVDAPAGVTHAELGPPTVAAVAGRYTVRLSRARVVAGVATPLLVTVTANGRQATDLHPYLGAYAHVVAVSAADRSYTHVHAMAEDSGGMTMSGGSQMDMDMGSASTSPSAAQVPSRMHVTLLLPKRGSYKLWFQFMGGATLYAAPFVVVAE